MSTARDQLAATIELLRALFQQWKLRTDHLNEQIAVLGHPLKPNAANRLRTSTRSITAAANECS